VQSKDTVPTEPLKKILQTSSPLSAFWDTAPCSFVEISRRFRGVYCLYRQDDESYDEGSTHFWNVGLLLRDYTALYPIRLSSSYSPPWELEIWWNKISFAQQLILAYILTCIVIGWIASEMKHVDGQPLPPHYTFTLSTFAKRVYKTIKTLIKISGDPIQCHCESASGRHLSMTLTTNWTCFRKYISRKTTGCNPRQSSPLPELCKHVPAGSYYPSATTFIKIQSKSLG
jgi:hypothetical protein